MAQIIKPPHAYGSGYSVFLAGSIEMGVADNWQVRVERALSDLDIIIYNPRRDDWDSSWEQSIENPQFRQQVEWELGALECADIIALYFDPTTKSPISLLELGLFCVPLQVVWRQKIIVCCPTGYWRKGNVDIVCQRYRIRQKESLEELVDGVVKRCAHAAAGTLA